jgi:hypothetical protein
MQHQFVLDQAQPPSDYLSPDSVHAQQDLLSLNYNPNSMQEHANFDFEGVAGYAQENGLLGGAASTIQEPAEELTVHDMMAEFEKDMQSSGY